MPVSVACRILANMAEEKHIDHEIFELFLRERIFVKYAQEFLSPDQLDEVDVEALLGTKKPAAA